MQYWQVGLSEHELAKDPLFKGDDGQAWGGVEERGREGMDNRWWWWPFSVLADARLMQGFRLTEKSNSVELG